MQHLMQACKGQFTEWKNLSQESRAETNHLLFHLLQYLLVGFISEHCQGGLAFGNCTGCSGNPLLYGYLAKMLELSLYSNSGVIWKS